MREMFDLQGDPLQSGEAAPGYGGAQDGAGLTPGELIRIAKRAVLRKWALVLLVAVPISALVWKGAEAKFKPSYAAEALIKVEPTVPNIAFTDEQWRAKSIVGFYGDYVRTLMHLTQSRGVALEAVKKLEVAGVDWLPPGVDPEDGPDHLRARIQVGLLRETHLFTVGFEDPNPSIVAEVVNAVTGVLLEHLELDAESGRQQRYEALSAESNRLEVELALTHARLDELSERLGSALLDERQNIFYERLNVMQQGMTDVFVSRVVAEGELEGAREEAVLLRGKLPEGELERLVDEDSAVRDARVTFGRLIHQEEGEFGHLAPDHPERQQSFRRIESAREQVNATVLTARERIAERLMSERSEQAERILLVATSRAEGARSSEERMREVMNQARADLADHGRAMFEGSQLRAKSKRIIESIRMLAQQIEQVKIESRAPGRTSISTHAVTPRQPSKDRRRLVQMMGVVVAFLCGLMAAVLLELLQGKVRDEADLVRTGAPFLGAGADGLTRVALELSSETGGPLGILLVAGDAINEGRTAEFGQGLKQLLEIKREVACLDLVGPRALNSGDYRSAADSLMDPSFDRMGGSAEWVVVSTPSPRRSAVHIPFTKRGYFAAIVVRRNVTRVAEVRDAFKELTASGARVLGTIFAESLRTVEEKA